MKKDTIEEIYKKYPKILSFTNTTDLVNKDGWAGILNILCKVLQSDADNDKHNQPIILNVSENIDGLILNQGMYDDSQKGQIRFIEQLSSIICRQCGARLKKTIPYQGWLFNVCDSCWEEDNDRYNRRNI